MITFILLLGFYLLYQNQRKRKKIYIDSFILYFLKEVIKHKKNV